MTCNKVGSIIHLSRCIKPNRQIGAWTEKWNYSTGFRITAYIKTDKVQGRGSFLALRWAVYNYPERYPYICSQKLVGTHDWTRVEAEIHGSPPLSVWG